MKRLTVAEVCKIYHQIEELFEAQGRRKRYKVLKIRKIDDNKVYAFYNVTEPVTKDGMISFYGSTDDCIHPIYVKIRGGIIDYSEEIVGVNRGSKK